MSEETDRHYADGYESGSLGLHKWMRRAERAEARIRELETEIGRLNMEMVAYREKLTPQDAAAMVSVSNALYAEKAARPLKHATWFDGGYLGNGHCSFMWARNGEGACCNLPHGHAGPHQEDPPQAAAATEG